MVASREDALEVREDVMGGECDELAPTPIHLAEQVVGIEPVGEVDDEPYHWSVGVGTLLHERLNMGGEPAGRWSRPARRNPRASSVLPLQRENAHTRSDASTTLAGYRRSGTVGGAWNVSPLYCILLASLSGTALAFGGRREVGGADGSVEEEAMKGSLNSRGRRSGYTHNRRRS